MTTRLTPEREREIRERANEIVRDADGFGRTALLGVVLDVPDLLAEIDARAVELRNSWTRGSSAFEEAERAQAEASRLLAEIDALRRERDEAREQRDQHKALLEVAQETAEIAQRGRERRGRLALLDSNEPCGPSFNAAAGSPES